MLAHLSDVLQRRIFSSDLNSSEDLGDARLQFFWRQLPQELPGAWTLVFWLLGSDRTSQPDSIWFHILEVAFSLRPLVSRVLFTGPVDKWIDFDPHPLPVVGVFPGFLDSVSKPHSQHSPISFIGGNCALRIPEPQDPVWLLG